MTLAVLAQIKVSRETVWLELKAAGYVWKRAKLKGRDDDPERAKRLARIRLLFENQRPDELILFADELDIDLLPKVGYQWMLKGTQLEIRTPGKNQKHYLAAALNPETGQTYCVLGPRKNNVLFRKLPDHLRQTFRKRYRRIYVVCDNYKIHKAKAVDRWLEEHSHFELVWLPSYCPRANPIERVFGDFTTNARATIRERGCELWSGTWKNIWRKTGRGGTDCQRSATLQKWIWKWIYYGSTLLLGSKSSVPILVALI